MLLQEDLGSVLHTHMVPQPFITLVPGDLMPLLASAGTGHIHDIQIYMHAKHSFTQYSQTTVEL